MRFLVDAQLPPQLARILMEAGHHAEHLESVGLRHAKDSDVWDYALREQAVIITKDEDFMERLRRRQDGPAIVWLRIGNAANAVLLTSFMPLLNIVVDRLESGEKLIEIRRRIDLKTP